MKLEEIQAYFDRVDPEGLWQALIFDAKLDRALLDDRYIYYSSLRPFAALPALRNAMKLAEADVLANVITRKGKEFGVVLTVEPLPHETIEAFDLLLDRHHTYAPLLQQYVGDKPAVAFREPPGARTDWGYLLFRNPRGNWQLSTFQPELGPIGHTESKDKYELLREALRYRPDDGAYIEAIMSTANNPVPLDGFAEAEPLWAIMRDGAMFKLHVTVGGRFDHDQAEERVLLLSASPDGSLHGHVYDTKYRLPLDGPVRFDTFDTPGGFRGHFTLSTQYGPRRGFLGDDWTDDRLVDDALTALTVWQDGLKEQGQLADFDVPAEEWKVRAAQAAQEVYDSWTQDEEGVDEVYGGGGICDDVANAIAGVLSDAGYEAMTFHYEQDNHTVVIAKMDGKTVEVDIPLHLYETGSWYNYRKIPGVVFKPEHITVVPVGPEAAYETYFDGVEAVAR